MEIIEPKFEYIMYEDKLYERYFNGKWYEDCGSYSNSLEEVREEELEQIYQEHILNNSHVNK